MSVVLFCGPTLPHAAARALMPEAKLLPPVECGDVYLACKESPKAIAIIDGYFDHRLSVWHKELLFALSRGIRVYGAASMGALRAAELAAHGMVGVGSVFELYNSGRIEDDDEVAVLHEAAEYNYRVQSDAMVNIRATLTVARECGLLDAGAEATIISSGKSLFYAERTFEAAVCVGAERAGFDKEALLRWYQQHGIVDQKRLDAEALIERLRRDASSAYAGGPSKTPAFVSTNYWDLLRRGVEARVSSSYSANASHQESDVEELLERAAAGSVELRSELELTIAERALSLELARQRNFEPTGAQEQQVLSVLQRELGLDSQQDLNCWLQENDLNAQTFKELLRAEAAIDCFADHAHGLAARQVLSVLRLAGLYKKAVQG